MIAQFVIASLLALLLVWLPADAPASARTLVINAHTSDPASRAAWDHAVVRFQRENPEIDVQLNIYDHESYKTALRNWLTSSPPDVVFWFVGRRMRELVVRGLLDDVSELYTPEVRRSLPPGGSRSGER
jgi:multiple sugar transport system substrate-binding protein